MTRMTCVPQDRFTHLLGTDRGSSRVDAFDEQLPFSAAMLHAAVCALPDGMESCLSGREVPLEALMAFNDIRSAAGHAATVLLDRTLFAISAECGERGLGAFVRDAAYFLGAVIAFPGLTSPEQRAELLTPWKVVLAATAD